MREYDVRKKAAKRVKEKKDFFSHLISFVSTMVFLVILNMLTSPEYWWFIWPLLGWGIGIVSHYFTVFGFFGMGTRDWEEREIRKEIAKIKQKELEPDVDEDVLELEDDRLELKDKIKLRRNWDDQDLV